MRTINLNAKSQEMKTLNAFMKEPNEFKRYLLCQMWIVQLFTETITEPINKHSKPATSNEDLTNENIYNIFRDIKTNLINENEQLTATLKLLKNQRDVLKVMDGIFELQSTEEIKKITDELDKLQTAIDTHTNYIEKINSLSVTKIEQLRNACE